MKEVQTMNDSGDDGRQWWLCYLQNHVSTSDPQVGEVREQEVVP